MVCSLVASRRVWKRDPRLACRPNLRSSGGLESSLAGWSSHCRQAAETVTFFRTGSAKIAPSWGGGRSTAQVRGSQLLHTPEGCFYRSSRIANEFFSLTHHTRWQYTSCNIPSGRWHSRHLPECLGGKRKWLLRRPRPSPLVNPLPRRPRRSPRSAARRRPSVAPRRRDARVLSAARHPSG
jgi:hypothetical protein